MKYGGKSGPWFSTHNAYIQIAADLGFFGILAYLALIFFIFRQNTQCMKFNREKENVYLVSISQGLKGALIAYAVGSFFLSVGYYPHLYLLLGLTIVLEILSRQASPEKGIRK